MPKKSRLCSVQRLGFRFILCSQIILALKLNNSTLGRKRKKVKSLSHVLLFVTPVDCSLPGSSIHGVLQARILEWVAISFSSFILEHESQSVILLFPCCVHRYVFYNCTSVSALQIGSSLPFFYSSCICVVC